MEELSLYTDIEMSMNTHMNIKMEQQRRRNINNIQYIIGHTDKRRECPEGELDVVRVEYEQHTHYKVHGLTYMYIETCT